MPPDRRVERGAEARQILESEVFKESYEILRATYISKLESLPESDDQARFRYVEALKQVNVVRRHLEEVIANGELAKREAEQFRTLTVVEKITRRF